MGRVTLCLFGWMSLKAEMGAVKEEHARLHSEHSLEFSDNSNQEHDKKRARLNGLKNQLSYLRKYESENRLPINRSKKIINNHGFGNDPKLLRDQLNLLEIQKAILNMTMRRFDESLRMRRLDESHIDAQKKKVQLKTIRDAIKINEKHISGMRDQMQSL